MSGVLAMILAGGEGTRLMPLTDSRSKPAVTFGGSYRIVDFVLNNFVNSGILKIFVITQYKSQSLMMHLKHGWQVSGIPGAFIDTIPAQMRVSKEWYQGTADAIYQNLSFIKEQFPHNVCVFGSDHIYKMDVRQMLNYHVSKNADLTVAALTVKVEEAKGKFGVIEVNDNGQMIGFEEKPQNPKELPSKKGYCLVSMGNYIFKANVLCDVLECDHDNVKSNHDFGKNIIEQMITTHKVFVYDFSKAKIDGESNECYWRDVGSIDSFWSSHMDLLGDHPKFNLHNPKWPLHTYYPPLPPANFIDTDDNESIVSMSLISAGCEINGASITKSVLGFRCRAYDGAVVEGSVLIGDNIIGKGAKIKNVILDRYVQIAPNFNIGFDCEQDRKLLMKYEKDKINISENGIIVIGKNLKIGFD